MATKRCPVCSGSDLQAFFQVSDVPAHIGLQWPTAREAQNCPRGDLDLVLCQSCGFITNQAFDPQRLAYSADYNNALHHSSVFQAYDRSVAQDLVDRYDLYDKDVVDIGCGKGAFLNLLCKLGNNRGVGFDPSYEGQTEVGRVRFVRDFYSEDYADCKGDLVCSRFVFEHVAEPAEFLKCVHGAVKDGQGTVYFEVPNAMAILRDLAVWDLIYEHCSYFTQKSLAQTFVACGFDVHRVAEVYDRQYLCIEATPSAGSSGGPDGRRLNMLRHYASRFGPHYRRKLGVWRDLLKRVDRDKQKVVLWGAGAKGVSFLNLLGVHKTIDFAVDINPDKQGKYMPGTGQEIVPPAFLEDYRPDTVVVMNAVYKDEIRRQVNAFGLNPYFWYA